MSTEPIWLNIRKELLEFDRLCAEVIKGRRVSTFSELLQSVPLYKSSLAADADNLARRVLALLHRENDPDGKLAQAMARLTASHQIVDFTSAARAFPVTASIWRLCGEEYQEEAARCWFYAAISGDVDAVKQVAIAAVSAPADVSSVASAARQIKGVLAWALAAADIIAIPDRWTRESADEFILNGGLLGNCLEEVIERTIERRTAAQVEAPKLAEGGAVTPDASAEAKLDRKSGAVVFTNVGNPDTPGGRRIAHALKPLLGKCLPLITVPDIVALRQLLVDEFPHALAVIDAVLEPMLPARIVGFQPTILVGPPGCGKTTFAMRLGETVGVPFEVFPCGGVSDSALVGTPRRWSSGEPSLPVQVIQSTQCANPLIVLDEIDKGATSRHNGNFLDGLLSLWERRTAETWRDPYIEAPVNLACINWLGTANSLEDIPRSVRDRARIIAFPAPRLEHLRAIAFYLMRDLARGDVRWVRPLDDTEATALGAAWTDGSIRSLAKLLASVLKTREMFDVRH